MRETLLCEPPNNSGWVFSAKEKRSQEWAKSVSTTHILLSHLRPESHRRSLLLRERRLQHAQRLRVRNLRAQFVRRRFLVRELCVQGRQVSAAGRRWARNDLQPWDTFACGQRQPPVCTGHMQTVSEYKTCKTQLQASTNGVCDSCEVQPNQTGQPDWSLRLPDPYVLGHVLGEALC